MASRNGRRDLKISALRSRRATAFHAVCGASESVLPLSGPGKFGDVLILADEVKDSADALLTNLGGGRIVTQTLSRIALQFWIPAKEDLALDKRVSEVDARPLAAVARLLF